MLPFKKGLGRYLAILFNINEAGNGQPEANEKSNGVHELTPYYTDKR